MTYIKYTFFSLWQKTKYTFIFLHSYLKTRLVYIGIEAVGARWENILPKNCELIFWLPYIGYDSLMIKDMEFISLAIA